MAGALSGWTSTQRHVVAASYLGWTLDAFDFLLITYVLKDIAHDFNTSTKALGFIITATLVMRPLGAFIFGRLADRFGRRPVLMADVGIYSVLAFASAFAPNLYVFLALRCLFGIAMGGEWGLGASLTMEHVKTESRGFVSGLLQTGYPTGGLIAGLVSAAILPVWGWRACVMVSVIPALLVLYIRRNVPESPAWREPVRQVKTVQVIESWTMALYLVVLYAAAIAATLLFPYLGWWGAGAAALPIVLAVSYRLSPIVQKHWGIALFAVVLMAGFNSLSHGTQDFYPSFLRVQIGLDPRTASLIASIGSLGAIVGGLTFGGLSQRIGRRRAMTIGAALVLPLIYLWVFFSVQPLVLGATAFALQFAVQGAWGVVPAHLNELSPADARATFPGFVYQLGNLFAAGITTLQGTLIDDAHWTYAQVLAIVAAAAALLIAVLVNLGPEAREVKMAPDASQPA